MSGKSVLEKLQETNINAKIWRDSPPLVYADWAKSIVEKAPTEKWEGWKKQLWRLFDLQNSEDTIFWGVTTNPPLSLAAVKDDPSSRLTLSGTDPGNWSRRIPARKLR